jgi:hypothetical protein
MRGRPRSKAVDHPAVLAEAIRGDVGYRPVLRGTDDLPIVTYRRASVTVLRSAWDLLPARGVILIRVHPTNGATPFGLALTAAEMQDVFGEVAEVDCWHTRGCYSFPTIPASADAYRIAVAEAWAGPRERAARTRPRRRTLRPAEDRPFERLAWARSVFDDLGEPDARPT